MFRPVAVIRTGCGHAVTLLSHPHARSPAAGGPRCDGTIDRQHVTHLWGQALIDALQLLIREVHKAHSPGLRNANARAGCLVGFTERHTFTNQPFGKIGGQGKPSRCKFPHAIRVKTSAWTPTPSWREAGDSTEPPSPRWVLYLPASLGCKQGAAP